ncbi:MAG: hypothetical protein QNI84_15020 [Henriciella sp.]|nr:hypothetical protein [Henriciella sp.]
MMKQALIAISALGLAACGFTPLYATDTGGAGNIQIEQINGRSGHTLRKALIQHLAPGLPGLDGPATLTIELDDGLQRLALQPDEAASRTDATARADYVLAFDGNAISGRVEAETSFLVPSTPYADIPAQIDATERAVSVLARRITDDMRLKLAQLGEPGDAEPAS